jgi:hypothetical protein
MVDANPAGSSLASERMPLWGFQRALDVAAIDGRLQINCINSLFNVGSACLLDAIS